MKIDGYYVLKPLLQNDSVTNETTQKYYILNLKYLHSFINFHKMLKNSSFIDWFSYITSSRKEIISAFWIIFKSLQFEWLSY